LDHEFFPLPIVFQLGGNFIDADGVVLLLVVIEAKQIKNHNIIITSGRAYHATGTSCP
jgi:hypothetical protein